MKKKKNYFYGRKMICSCRFNVDRLFILIERQMIIVNRELVRNLCLLTLKKIIVVNFKMMMDCL